MARHPRWPYPSFDSTEWLRGDGSDPALNATRDAVRATVRGRGQQVDGSEECLAAGLTALADLAERIDWGLLALTGEARSRGMSWSDIGEALGISRQAVHKRFSSYVAQAVAQSDADTRPAAAGQQATAQTEEGRAAMDSAAVPGHAHPDGRLSP